jgi:hypothetical protein
MRAGVVVAKLNWTDALDNRLCRLRAEGAMWPAIGEELGVSADVARERGRRIGARPPVAIRAIPLEDPCRDALPAGHPRSWGMLVQGTLLCGLAWPGWTTPVAKPAGHALPPGSVRR